MAHKLRYFVRLDSKGEVVLGSLIARAKKPVDGSKWQEISPFICCDVLGTATNAVTGTTTTIKVYSKGDLYAQYAVVSTTLTTVASSANVALPGIGDFTAANGVISLSNTALTRPSITITYS